MENRDQRIESYKLELDRLLSQCGGLYPIDLARKAGMVDWRVRSDSPVVPFALKDRIAELEDLLAAHAAGLA